MLSSLHKQAGALKALVPSSSVFYGGSEPCHGRSEETGAWKSSQPPLLSHPHTVFLVPMWPIPLKACLGMLASSERRVLRGCVLLQLRRLGNQEPE